jgi:hypothetical protein
MVGCWLSVVQQKNEEAKKQETLFWNLLIELNTSELTNAKLATNLFTVLV